MLLKWCSNLWCRCYRRFDGGRLICGSFGHSKRLGVGADCGRRSLAYIIIWVRWGICRHKILPNPVSPRVSFPASATFLKLSYVICGQRISCSFRPGGSGPGPMIGGKPLPRYSVCAEANTVNKAQKFTPYRGYMPGNLQPKSTMPPT